MPDKKIKKFKNPITGKTRTITKEDGYKVTRVEDKSGFTTKLKEKKKQKVLLNRNLKKGGKIRNMFKEQYD